MYRCQNCLYWDELDDSDNGLCPEVLDGIEVEGTAKTYKHFCCIYYKPGIQYEHKEQD